MKTQFEDLLVQGGFLLCCCIYESTFLVYTYGSDVVFLDATDYLGNSSLSAPIHEPTDEFGSKSSPPRVLCK